MGDPVGFSDLPDQGKLSLPPGKQNRYGMDRVFQNNSLMVLYITSKTYGYNYLLIYILLPQSILPLVGRGA